MNYTEAKWEIYQEAKCGEDWMIVDSEGSFIASTPFEANAHLIAASPDMEAVLTQFVRYCNQWQESNGKFPNGDGRILILENTKLALLKAKKVQR